MNILRECELLSRPYRGVSCYTSYRNILMARLTLYCTLYHFNTYKAFANVRNHMYAANPS
jgi:hypothetical protein